MCIILQSCILFEIFLRIYSSVRYDIETIQKQNNIRNMSQSQFQWQYLPQMINNICLKYTILLIYYTSSCTWRTLSFKMFLEIFLRIFYDIKSNENKIMSADFNNNICYKWHMSYKYFYSIQKYITFCSRSLFSNDWRTHTFYIVVIS